jgi:hypothetical protein
LDKFRELLILFSFLKIKIHLTFAECLQNALGEDSLRRVHVVDARQTAVFTER